MGLWLQVHGLLGHCAAGEENRMQTESPKASVVLPATLHYSLHPTAPSPPPLNSWGLSPRYRGFSQHPLHSIYAKPWATSLWQSCQNLTALEVSHFLLEVGKGWQRCCPLQSLGDYPPQAWVLKRFQAVLSLSAFAPENTLLPSARCQTQMLYNF